MAFSQSEKDGWRKSELFELKIYSFITVIIMVFITVIIWGVIW